MFFEKYDMEMTNAYLKNNNNKKKNHQKKHQPPLI